MIQILLTASILILCGTAQAQLKPGGYDEHPQVIRIHSKLRCSGIIISPHLVLTAGHCLRTEGQFKNRLSLNPRHISYVSAKVGFFNSNASGVFKSGQDYALVYTDEVLPLEKYPELLSYEDQVKIAAANTGIYIAGFHGKYLGFGISETLYKYKLKKKKISISGIKISKKLKGLSGAPVFVAEGPYRGSIMGLISMGNSLSGRISATTGEKFVAAIRELVAIDSTTVDRGQLEAQIKIQAERLKKQDEKVR